MTAKPGVVSLTVDGEKYRRVYFVGKKYSAQDRKMAELIRENDAFQSRQYYRNMGEYTTHPSKSI